MKGVCQNLSFDRLYEVSNELTELLRDRTGEKPGIPESMEKVTEVFILIPDNASWYTAIRSESLIKASYKIVKMLFSLGYTS